MRQPQTPQEQASARDDELLNLCRSIEVVLDEELGDVPLSDYDSRLAQRIAVLQPANDDAPGTYGMASLEVDILVKLKEDLQPHMGLSPLH